MKMRPAWCVLLLLSVYAGAQGAELLHPVADQIYRGKQPTRQDIAVLAQNGIRTVLDLRGPLDHRKWECHAVEAAGMRYVRVGMSGFFAPTNRQIAKILAVLEEPDALPVYLHCRRGSDRSGVVIACYRIAHDHWTNAQAMKEARKDGLSPFEVLMRLFILHFNPESLPSMGKTPSAQSVGERAR